MSFRKDIRTGRGYVRSRYGREKEEKSLDDRRYELGKARHLAHLALESTGLPPGRYYPLAASLLKITRERAHISMLSIEECYTLIKRLKRWLSKNKENLNAKPNTRGEIRETSF